MWVRKALFALLILSSPLLAQNPIGPISGGITPAVNTALGKKIDKKTLTQLGSTKQVYIWNRTDGVAGIGTESDPFDGSTQAKFDALMSSFSGLTNLDIHLGPGVFSTLASNATTGHSAGWAHNWVVKTGWTIEGQGMYITTIRAVGALPDPSDSLVILATDPNVPPSNVTIKDLTVDCNWTGLTGHPTGSGGESNIAIFAVGIGGTAPVAERVRCINQYGSFANSREAFGIQIGGTNGWIKDCVSELPHGTYCNPFALGIANGCKVTGSIASGVNDGNASVFVPGGVNIAEVTNCEISGNFFFDCGSIAYQDTGITDGLKVFNNIGVRCSGGVYVTTATTATKQRIEIYNNTIGIQSRTGGGEQDAIKINGAASNQVWVWSNILTFDQNGHGSTGLHTILFQNTTNSSIQNLISPDFATSISSNTALRMMGNRTPDGLTITGMTDTEVSAVTSAGIDSAFGSTRGSLLERGSGGWTILTPGTSGNVLMSNGTGADPSYQTVGGSGTVANPSAAIGLTAINGSNTSAIRSDGAPALSQAIVPTWTGLHTFQITDAVTSTFTDFQLLTHNSSGTPSNGFGGSILHMLQTSTSPSSAAERDIYYWTDATHATRSSAYRMQLRTNAGLLSDVFYVFGDGGMSLFANVDPGAGVFNVNTGYRIGNAATSTHFLRGNGTNYVDSAILAGDVPDLSSTYLTPSNTAALTSKTFDASATGNVLKRSEYIQLGFPDNGDGTNAVRVTTEGPTFGHYTFKAGIAKASNYVIYRMRVPDDLDTAVDLAAAFKFRLGGADTGTHSYYISMANVASSASADSPTFSNEVAISFAGDASGASGDVEHVTYVTLTSWKASLTPGQTLVIKLARDGTDGTLDSSTVDSTDLNLALRYGSSQ